MSDGDPLHDSEPAAGDVQDHGVPAHDELDAAWLGMLHQLSFYRIQHGHCFVPRRDRRHPQLAAWLAQQVMHFHKGILPKDKQRELEALGMEWDVDDRKPAPRQRAEARWESRLEELVAFKEKHGHLGITKTNEPAAGLSHWRDNQRLRLRSGVMPPGQKARLDDLGFEWEAPARHGAAPREAHRESQGQWERCYARLVEFHRLNGHANVPGRPDRLLRKWVLEQREKRGEGSLDEEQIARLEALGFAWETPHRRSASSRPPRNQQPSIWDQRFEELQAFVAAHGHFRVPKKQDEFKTLRHWVVAQRRYQRRGSILPAHREKLAAIGFPWDPGKESERGRGGEAGGRNQAKRWNDRFCDLGAFKERHGHTHVPHHRGPDMKLGGWLVRQRRLRRLGQLAPDRIQRLESLGVDWGAPTSVTHGGWDLRMAELREFHAQHGHANVPTKYPPNRLLGNWVSNTRILYKAGKLGAECIQELEALGFRWRGERNNPSRLDAAWEATFSALLEFREAHGHANVLRTSQSYPALADWVASQRLKHRRGALQEDRVRKLEAIGFRWGKQTYQAGLQKSWDQRFAELVAFRRQHGHPHVSKADKAHRSLEIWAKTQRVFYHQGKLSADRIQQLESIGFTWNGNEGWWERQFRRWEGATQRRRTRHITVIGDPDDDLARWEQIQRTLHRQGKLSPEKASLLTRAGLIFEAP